MKYTVFFIIWLLSAGCKLTFGQINPNEPAPPILYLVSIDIETGNVIIIWEHNPLTPEKTDYYQVYELQPQFPGDNTCMPISEFIDKNVTQWVITSNPRDNSVGYTVVALNDIGGGAFDPSQWDDPDSTIYLESQFDSCEATITLEWNDYNNWRGSIASYNVYRYIGTGIYELITTLEEGTNIYLLEGLLPNQTYDLFIEAVHDDGVRRSNSNRIAVFTQMSQVPDRINADYATISQANNIDLSFSVNPVPGQSHYNLLRSNSFDGPFTLIQSFDQSASKIEYTDQVPFTSSIWYYRLEVLNSCDSVAASSNRANNIILNANMSDLVVSLNWNEYRDWLGGVQGYTIIRTIGRTNPEIDTLSATAGGTTFSDDVGYLADYENPGEGLICYAVIATENTNIYGIQGKSKSNQVCFSVNPTVRIPNAFIPNDSDPANQVFEPLFSFLPEHYEMIIYNRLGSKIWEGSQAWDGQVDGKYVPEGVYLYFIRIFDYASKTSEFNGKVTVLYR